MKDPWQHIPPLLERVNAEYLCKTYGVEDWDDAEDFLSKLAAKTGKLLKVRHYMNGEVEMAAMFLHLKLGRNYSSLEGLNSNLSWCGV